MCTIYISATLLEDSLEGEGFQNSRVATPFLPNRIRNVLPDSEQLFATLPHRCIKWLPYQRTTTSDEELTERRQPPILRCDKCLWPGKVERAGLSFKIIFTNDPLGLTVHTHETASIHQYLKQLQVFIEPGTLSMLNVFTDAVCVAISAFACVWRVGEWVSLIQL